MKKIKVGIIGCGKIAHVNHVPGFIKHAAKAEITALFDVNQTAAEKLNEEHRLNATVYPSVKKLLESNVDAVAINTPNNTHYRLSMDALRAGAHVLVEKPMAVNLSQADAMIALAKEKSLVLQVNQSLRYAPVYQKIKELIETGKIGTPLHIRCLRAGGKTPDQGWSKGATWFVQKKFNGGLIMDIAVHMADIMGWYMGKADKVFAINSTRIKGNDVPDNVTAIMDFANGATGVLELSWTFPSGGALLEIYGTKGAIRLGFSDSTAQLSTDGKEYKPIKPRKAKTSQECFIDAINGKAPSPSSGEVGRHALAYCVAIAKSGETGRPVSPLL